MPEKTKQELLQDLQQLKQEHNALKSLYDNKKAENEKLSERLHSFEWMLKKKQSAAKSLDAMLNSTADGILAAEKMGEVIFFNRQFADMWHIPQSILDSGNDNKLMEHVLDQLVDPKSFIEKVQQLYASNENSFDLLHFKDGRIFERHSQPLKIKSAGRVWSFRDITKQKRMEDSLRESEEQHRRLFETMSQGVIYQAADGKIVSANPAAERYLGLTTDQMLGKTSMDPRWEMISEDGKKVPGSDHPAMIALRTGKKVGPVTRGIFIPEKDKYAWLSITAIPLFKPGKKKPFQVYTTFDDITDKKQKEIKEEVLYEIANATFVSEDVEALLANIKKLLNNLIDTTNFYVALYDKEKDMFSIAYEADEKDEIEKWTAKKSATGLVVRNKKALLLKKPDILKLVESGEIEQIGSICEAWLGVPLLSGSDIIGVLVVQDYHNPNTYDKGGKEILEYVSSQISMAIQRKNFIEALKESNKNLEEMVYIASHDLQSPLLSMESYADELLNNYKNKLDEEGKYCLQRLKSNSSRMQSLVQSLLDISRLNTTELKPQKFELKQIVNKTIRDLSLTIDEKNANVKVNDLPTIYADKQRIETVLRNIISNALNYGGKNIEISFHNNTLSIKDDGAGIPSSQLERIFRPGERLKSVKVDGVGMGLAFCKKVITLHGGKIWAESEGKNKGTTIFINFNAKNILTP